MAGKGFLGLGLEGGRGGTRVEKLHVQLYTYTVNIIYIVDI